MNLPPALKEKVRHEAKSFAVIFFYLWAILGLLALYRDFLEQRNPLYGQIFPIINAIILGKVILILEFFRVGERLHARPAIFRILYKSVLFGLLLLLVHIMEEVIRGWFHHKAFSETLTEIDNGRLFEIGTLVILVIIALVPYFTLREITRVIGLQKLVAIIFGPPAVNAPPAAGE